MNSKEKYDKIISLHKQKEELKETLKDLPEASDSISILINFTTHGTYETDGQVFAGKPEYMGEGRDGRDIINVGNPRFASEVFNLVLEKIANQVNQINAEITKVIEEK